MAKIGFSIILGVYWVICCIFQWCNIFGSSELKCGPPGEVSGNSTASHIREVSWQHQEDDKTNIQWSYSESVADKTHSKTWLLSAFHHWLSIPVITLLLVTSALSYILKSNLIIEMGNREWTDWEGGWHHWQNCFFLEVKGCILLFYNGEYWKYMFDM